MKRFRRTDDERGMTLVFTAVFMVGTMALVALAVDGSNGRQQRRQAQNAADAASLAAADWLAAHTGDFSGAVTAAKKYVYSNFGVDQTNGWTNCTDANALSYRPDSGAPNVDTCISFDSQTTPTKAHVRIPPKSVATFFGGFANQTSLAISAWAEASITSTGTASSCGLCMLASYSSDPGLQDTASANLNVVNTNMIVNDLGNPAANKTGSGGITASCSPTPCTTPTIGGPNYQYFNTSHPPFSTPAPTNQAATADPLANHVTCPNTGGVTPCPTGPAPGSCGSDSNGVAYTLCPGVFTTAVTQATANLAPGIYVFENKFSVSSKLTANNVTLYFACTNYPLPCAPGTQGGFFTLSTSQPSTITAPTSGDFAGIAVFFDRNNTSNPSAPSAGAPVGTPLQPKCGGGGVSMISASATSTITGTVYMASGCLDITGGGGTLGSDIITGLFEYTGSSAITVDPTQGLNALGGTTTVQLYR